MSAAYQIVDLRDVPGSLPFIQGSQPKAEDTPLDIWVTHEQQDPLVTKELVKVGKTTTELVKEKQALEAQGFRYLTENLDKVYYQEVRPRPKLYLARFKGSAKEFDKWFSGETQILPDGTVREVSAPHLRSWVVGNNGQMGDVQLEPDLNKIKKYFADMGKFSTIEELDWQKFKELR